MVFQRIIARFPGRSRISGETQRLFPPNSNSSVKLSDQSLKPLSQITQTRHLSSGISENNQGKTLVLHNAMPRFLGNSGMKLGFAPENSLPCSVKFAKSIHSVGPKEYERGPDNWPVDTEKNSQSFEGSNQKSDDIDGRQVRQPPIDTGRRIGYFDSLTRRYPEADRTRAPIGTGQDGSPLGRPIGIGQNVGGFESLTRRFAEMGRIRDLETGQDGRPVGRGFGPFEYSRPMNLARGNMRENESYRSGTEQNADIVHIKIMRNNTFVTVTDSKGNKKMGASAGSLAEMKGGPKVSRYSAEATAEHVGRVAKSMGLKSVVMKVNGFTLFKRKKLAILSFRDGYTNSRSDQNPIVYIEDTTRKPHNGCRLRKQRRV